MTNQLLNACCGLVIRREDPLKEAATLKIDLNTHVELELLFASGDSERLSIDLVRDNQADFYAGFLGAGTALGKAILGHEAGDELPYRAGETRAVRILAVTPSKRLASDQAARRERVIRDAVAESELKDRIAVATSVDNKWGDYDPAGLQQMLENESQKQQGKESEEDGQ